MRVRHPQGRAGRPWLAHRLDVARRGAHLLDERLRALERERRWLEPLAAEADAEWRARAGEAARWLARAVVLGGERQLAAGEGAPPAEVAVRWRSVVGVACPAEVEVSVRPDERLSARGGGAALLVAADAHREALRAAARLAVTDGALRRVRAELRATALRRNAIERRWIPAHEAALAALDLSLEEAEREAGMVLHRLSGPLRDA